MASKTKKQNTKWKEITWYVIAAVIFLFGLTIAIFSVIGDYIGATNFIKQAEQATQDALKIALNWRTWGLIFIGVAAFIASISLYVYGNKHEKIEAKESTKSARTKLVISEKEPDVDLTKTAEENEETK